MKRKKNNEYSQFFIVIFVLIGAYFVTDVDSIREIILKSLLFIICILSFNIVLKRYKINKTKEQYLKSGIDIVDKMEGTEFEKFLLAHFKNLGYKGEVTPKTNDYGADLVLKKEKYTIVVQAKRYKSKVGIEAIQQIIGAKEYYKANKCIVATNSYFTNNAINLANSSNVELWDRNKLISLMARVNGREILENNINIEEVQKREIICKKCGSNMIVKKGKYGDFLGCSNFPKCRYTEKINEKTI